MEFEHNKDLTSLNTLNIQSFAEYYYEVFEVDELVKLLNYIRLQQLPYVVLGGGSNVILPPFIKGVVIRMAITGCQVKPLNSEQAEFVVGAGENWHEFVQHTIQQGYRGLENLSLIPGTVGAAPVQNIGAYGVEVKDHLTEVTVIDLSAEVLTQATLKNDQLDFEYRNSLFKKNPGQYIILSVAFSLDKRTPLKTSYGDIAERLGEGEVTAKQVSEAVIAARRSKLPDVSAIPNAGSFFKNPIVSAEKLKTLKEKYPNIISYPLVAELDKCSESNSKTGGKEYKLAAGWLIQDAGWKGYRNDKVGVHAKQALVIVNHNHGSAGDILSLAKEIRESIEDKFGVLLEVEPVVV